MTARDEILAVLPELRARLGRDTFSPEDVVAALRSRGTTLADSTIRTHVVSRMCANSPDNHARVYDDFERVGRGVYRPR